MKATRIESLTFLRFVAALIVVIFHYGKKTTLVSFAQPAIIAAAQMVTFFFVLSGFVLMVAYYSESKSPKTFYLARIARILPMYLIALCAMCYFQYNKRGISDYVLPLLHLTFLQAWFSTYTLKLNGPAWSLSVEAFFYLTFPIVLRVIKNTKIKFQLLLLIAFVFWLFTQAVSMYLFNSEFYTGPGTASQGFITFFPLFHYCSFLLGVAGGYAFIETQHLHQNSGKKNFVLLVLAFVLTYLMLQYPDIYIRYLGFALPIGGSFYGPAFLVLILCIAYSKNSITKFLSLPPLLILGEASYALYILQMPVHFAYEAYLTKRLGLYGDNDFYTYLCLLICLSILSFYVIEKPARKLILKSSLWIDGLTHHDVLPQVEASDS
jgi:peptidoglycan/LPS O-acetylase OafA/YrhL